jgi:SAM-dependent methyltransferase
MTVPTRDELLGHYRDLLRKHGDTPGATQASREGQLFRFHKLFEIADLDGRRVLDVGAGIGDMYPLLRERFPRARYEGIEVVPEMVAFAAAKYPDVMFRVANLLQNTIPERYDYVLLSGIFNNAVAEGSFLEPLIERAWALAERGLGFNFISTHVNFTQPEMAYHDPAAVMDFCARRLSPKLSLQHHYARCDVAVFVYR